MKNKKINKIYCLISLLLKFTITSGMSHETSIEMTDFKKTLKKELNTKLQNSIHSDNSYQLKESIEQGADVNHVLYLGNQRSCVLHFSIFNNSIKCFYELLKNKNLNLNTLNTKNETPLLYLLKKSNKNLDMIKKILENGADANIAVKDENQVIIISPLNYIISGLAHRIYTINHFNNLDMLDYTDESDIDTYLEIIKSLLYYGADPESSTKTDRFEKINFANIKKKSIQQKLELIFVNHKKEVFDILQKSDVLLKVLNNIVYEYIFEK